MFLASLWPMFLAGRKGYIEHPFVMEMVAFFVHSALKWLLWPLPSLCYAMTSYANALWPAWSLPELE